jgi:hypothetical protein
MTTFIIVMICSLMSFVSYASEREFRIDRYAVDSGYAIGWGIPGRKINFEKIEKNQNDVHEFVNQYLGDVRNFLVDLETHSILAELGDAKDSDNAPDYVSFNLGDFHYGNHFSYRVKRLEISYGTIYDPVAVIRNNKWSNEIEKVLLIDRTKGVTIAAEVKGLQNQIIQGIREKLSGPLKKMLDERVIVMEIESVRDERYLRLNKITLHAEIPRSEKPTLLISALVYLKEVDKDLKVDISKVKTEIIQ